MSAQPVSITNKDKSLIMEFYPEVGGSFGSLKLTRDGKTVDILRPYDPAVNLHEFNMASFPMVPMCGRTDYGQFEFNTASYHVGPNSEGEPHPNHGNGRSQPWEVTKHEGNSITMELVSKADAEMPHDYTASQTITVGDKNVVIDMNVKNDGKDARPFGIGHHLYFARTPKTKYGFEADYMWQSVNAIPSEKVDLPSEFNFSTPKTLDPAEQKKAYGNSGTAYMDHTFGGYKGETTISQPEHGVTTTYKIDQHNFTSFIPSDADFICCWGGNMPDGFNRLAKGEKDTGVVVLQPGQSMSVKMTLEIS